LGGVCVHLLRDGFTKSLFVSFLSNIHRAQEGNKEM